MAEKFQLPELACSDDFFLNELSQEVTRQMDRHDNSPRIFVPAEIEAEIAQAIRDKSYMPDDEPIPEEVIDALIVNLLTEDGLPYYTSTLEHVAPPDHPFTEWIHWWTAEEGRHSPSIFAFIKLSGKVDLRWLEAARMHTMRYPETPHPKSFIEGLVYPTIQEVATEISHRNTINKLPDTHRKMGRKSISPVVGDEVKHGIFYGNLSEAAFKIDSSTTIIAIARQIKSFSMPGRGIPDFDNRSEAIENAGIFGLRQLKNIYDDLLSTRWPIESAEGLSPDAEKARDLIIRKLGTMAKILSRRDEREEAATASS
jgi:acyl-[acyl-carrier-protein] desaturase